MLLYFLQELKVEIRKLVLNLHPFKNDYEKLKRKKGLHQELTIKTLDMHFMGTGVHKNKAKNDRNITNASGYECMRKSEDSLPVHITQSVDRVDGHDHLSQVELSHVLMDPVSKLTEQSQQVSSDIVIHHQILRVWMSKGNGRGEESSISNLCLIT